ncbi:hypothetical protein AAGV28_13735 [Flavobacterium sp. FZUC8N2.13]|uniref:Uncharacterized protein n=1 Tax=Flavobacterium zubiriense TaxID=3138075 RepID=A0ABV4TEM8_9FLAO
MKQLTVTIPDDFYETFVSFIKHIPDVSVEEDLTDKKLKYRDILDETPIWQLKNTTEEK